VKQSKFKVYQRVFKKDTSVFKDWKEDTAEIMTKCSEHDQQHWKVPRFVKDLRE
jgi:NLR family CARD domain-containing protein 3